MTRNWDYKVVKSQLANGAWFSYPAAATFVSLDEARQYAITFADNQRAAGVTGTRINVLSRRKMNGPPGPTNNALEIRL